MNLLVFSREDICQQGLVLLSGERARHLSSVLKVRVGSELRAGEENGQIGRATVVKMEPDKVWLKIGSSEPKQDATKANKVGCGEQAPRESLGARIELILALPRPQTLKKVLELAGAVGVERISLVNAARVEKSFFSSSVLHPEHIAKHLRLGMEQGASTCLPEVKVFQRFTDIFEPLEEESSTSSSLIGEHDSRLRLIAQRGADSKMLSDPLFSPHFASSSSLLAAVGPEGGWLPKEVQSFIAAGFVPCALGDSILRVEHAVCYLLAQVELMRGCRGHE